MGELVHRHGDAEDDEIDDNGDRIEVEKSHSGTSLSVPASSIIHDFTLFWQKLMAILQLRVMLRTVRSRTVEETVVNSIKRNQC